MMKIKLKLKKNADLLRGHFGVAYVPSCSADADLGMETFSTTCSRSQIALFNSHAIPEAL
jgi:hypothetical protein